MVAGESGGINHVQPRVTEGVRSFVETPSPHRGVQDWEDMKMTKVSKEFLQQFIQENNLKSAEDVQTALRDLFASTMQGMLEAELETELGYAKHDAKSKTTKNSRNGHSRKTVMSEFGEAEIAVPRDRQGEFEPEIIKKHQTKTTGVEEQVIALYARGMSTRDIQSHLNHLYGVEVSPTLISNITDKLLPLIKEWQSRPLQSVYAAVFLDAIHYKVRPEGRVINKAAYMVIGIDLEGGKDVLGMWIGENESSKFWLTVLNELKGRGVEDILIISVDNLTGFSEAIAACYPKTDIQRFATRSSMCRTRTTRWSPLHSNPFIRPAPRKPHGPSSTNSRRPGARSIRWWFGPGGTTGMNYPPSSAIPRRCAD